MILIELLWHVVKGLMVNIYWKERYKDVKKIDKDWSSGLHITRCKDIELELAKDDIKDKINKSYSAHIFFIQDIWDLG